MARAGGRRAAPRKRNVGKPSMSTVARRAVPAVGLAAVLVAAVAAVAGAERSGTTGSLASTMELPTTASASALKPEQIVSRSAKRAPLVAPAVEQARVKGQRFAARDLVIRASRSDSSKAIVEVASGERIGITGTVRNGWAQVIDGSSTGWVVAAALTKVEPLGSRPCPNFPESGLTPDGVKALRAVCAKWPSIRQIGTTGGAGEHATGQALDIMLGPDIGYDVAAFLQENSDKLGVEYVIYRMRIWRPATSSQWRSMSDRGSPTQNHMDHVHVTVYGTAASN